MDKIRIGKDIFISWELTTTDESVILSKDNLSLEMTLPNRCIAQLPINFNNGVLYSSFYGIDQTQLGNYWLTVWYKRNEVGQSALDKVLAFQLVRSTEDETHNDESIAYADINLSGTIEINGGTDLHYYSEDLQKKEAKIDNGYSSLVFDDDDDGSINFNAAHSQITDDNGNHIIVGSMSVDGVPCGVQVATSENEKFLYNNDEVATKNDIANYATTSQLTAHTTNSTIHVTAADKQRWDNKQDAIPYTFTSMTQSAYDALETKDNNTIYFITE